MSFEIPIYSVHQYFISQKKNIKTYSGEMEFIESIPTNSVEIEFSTGRLYEESTYYIDPKGKMYTNPKVFIDFGNPLEFNRFYEGKPEFTYKGETYLGYRNLSYAIYGKYDPLIESKVLPYLENDFDIHKIKFKEWRTFKGNKYPVYVFGKEIIKGKKGLRERFPLQDEEVFEVLIKIIPKEKERHEELIHRYNIRVEDDQIKATRNYNHYELRNMSHLQETLRDWNETVSHSTKKKLSDELGL